MNQLTNEIKNSNTVNNQTQKNVHIIKARKNLMSILVHKMTEYLHDSDSQLAADIFNDIAK